MSASLTNLIIHVVFGTKNREPYLGPEIRMALFPYIGGIIRNKGGVLLEIGGVEDHVHILMKMRQDITVADMVRAIKSNSSKWLNEQPRFRQNRFAWQTGYSAFSVSESQVFTVRSYLQRQEKHHGAASFQDEYLEFLHKNGIAYDERHVWG